jgi:hypothetical protein
MVTAIAVDRDEEAAKAKFLTERASLILERIPASYRDTDPSDPRLDPRVISACGAWEYAPKARGLGFCGETGLGKTRGIYWLMLRLMRQVTFEKNRYGLEATYLKAFSGFPWASRSRSLNLKPPYLAACAVSELESRAAFETSRNPMCDMPDSGSVPRRALGR